MRLFWLSNFYRKDKESWQQTITINKVAPCTVGTIRGNRVVALRIFLMRYLYDSVIVAEIRVADGGPCHHQSVLWTVVFTGGEFCWLLSLCYKAHLRKKAWLSYSNSLKLIEKRYLAGGCISRKYCLRKPCGSDSAVA